MADLLITTTTGEGWGLSITEAMASKLPVVAPNHTACREIIGSDWDRGFLVESGGKDGTFTWGPHDRNVLRPRVWIDDMVIKMHYVWIMWSGGGLTEGEKDVYKADPEVLKQIVDRAYEWVPTWDSVGEAWRAIFARATYVNNSIPFSQARR
jgi:glycosyltransferase involved in cell wall biosynthesis